MLSYEASRMSVQLELLSSGRTDTRNQTNPLTTLELCAGGGGQALGYDQAGFEHIGLVEIDKHACATHRLNRPHWNVIGHALNTFDGPPYKGVDLILGGIEVR